MVGAGKILQIFSKGYFLVLLFYFIKENSELDAQQQAKSRPKNFLNYY